ncbi:MAG: hypothetical protein GEV28_17195 [Actinophytocola sp.]|uniref:serine hydrolase n=1 Tax=Actinophytocola sp. TaxID=1872138 RepID=UPI001328F2BB|nr:serine hydrolase [Actinophytocola sp.]MPZ82027.1 hypothetical protein [Actinophytocola sp.]
MRSRILLGLSVVALVLPGVPAVVRPAPPMAQLAWVVDASSRLPISEAEQREHLSAEFLSAIGGPAEFNETMAGFGALAPPRVLSSTPTSVEAVSGAWLVSLVVDANGLVGRLRFSPYAPSPSSWSELDGRLRALAPSVSFATFDVSAGCEPIHSVDGDVPRPLGSAFKLYVLGALARAVADGRASWDQELAIRDEWKSLPTGVLQEEPAGTRLPLREYANLMISISDNTATDHLIHFLGRRDVSRQLSLSGNRADGNVPFLTTRELFALKGFHYPALARPYLSLPPSLRHAVLPAANSVPRDRIEPWTTARDVEEIEWFGAPSDMCRAFAGLQSRHGAAVDHALSISDGGIGLGGDFPAVWYQGGAEPGVLTLNYLAHKADGRTLVSSVMLTDPDGTLTPSTQTEAFALARGGLELS